MMCPSPLRLKMKKKIYDIPSGTYVEHMGFVDVPCGKCVICLSNRKRDWVFRLSEEYRHCSSSYFIGLSYDDENLPLNRFGIGVLNPDHLQLYMKRLRKHFKNDKRIRFFAVGEYGSKTLRPHYHLLLFNIPPCDAYKEFPKLWPYGHTEIGYVCDQSINYVCKYVLAGAAIPDVIEDFKAYEVPLPFMRCSRRPAIGFCYLSESNVRYHRDRFSLMTVQNGYYTCLPRYYRPKIFDQQEIEQLGEEAQANSLVNKDFDKWSKKYGDHEAYKLVFESQQELMRKMKESFKLNRNL